MADWIFINGAYVPKTVNVVGVPRPALRSNVVVVDAADLTGVVSDSRLSSNVVLKNVANVFSRNQVVSGSVTASSFVGSFVGSGENLTGCKLNGDSVVTADGSGNLGASSLDVTQTLYCGDDDAFQVDPSGNITAVSLTLGTGDIQTYGNVFVNNTDSGVILKASDDSLWKIVVGANGVLSTVSVQ